MNEANIVAKMYQAMADNATIRKITAYVSAERTIKLTRQRKPTKRALSETGILTIGCPNYKERKFIRETVRDGRRFPTGFPTGYVQYDYWPFKVVRK